MPVNAQSAPNMMLPCVSAPMPTSVRALSTPIARLSAVLSMSAASGGAVRSIAEAPSISRRPDSSSARVWRITSRPVSSPSAAAIITTILIMPTAPVVAEYTGPNIATSEGFSLAARAAESRADWSA